MPEKGSDSRRLTRREQRQLDLEQRVTPIRTRGGLRFPKKLAVFASLALILATGVVGTAYCIDQRQPYTISQTEETYLIDQAINTQEITFDPSEVALWEKAEKDASNIPTDNLDTYNSQKLGLVKQAMIESHNPLFKPAIDDITDLIEHQTLRIIVSPQITSLTRNANAGMVTTADIGAGQRLDLGLHIPILVLIESSPLETALYFVHERTHMRQYIALDNANLHLSGQERRRALTTTNNTKDKSVEMEAEAYGEQAKAFIISKGQTGFNTIRPEEPTAAAHLIKSNNDSKATKFRAFIDHILSGKMPPR